MNLFIAIAIKRDLKTRKGEQMISCYKIIQHLEAMPITATACGFWALISSRRALLIGLVAGSFLGCAAHTSQPEAPPSAASRSSNPTLESYPDEESPYSFEKAYRERYGDEMLDARDQDSED